MKQMSIVVVANVQNVVMEGLALQLAIVLVTFATAPVFAMVSIQYVQILTIIFAVIVNFTLGKNVRGEDVYRSAAVK